MNIEEIKIRLGNLDAGKVVRYDNAMNLATQYMVDYKNDVGYLLSIIETAEKALEEVYECGSIRQAEIISGAALQVIRGN